MNAQNAPPLAGLPDTRPRAYEAAHRALARRAAAESIVLLKNEGTVLPLAVGSRLALYGAGALQMVKGGTGSGDVNARPAVEIYDGLQRGGFTVTNRAWLRRAADVYSAARAAWRDRIRNKLKTGEEPHFFAAYIRTPFRSPALPPPEKTDCDAALYVVSRTSGEGFDRTPDAGDFCLSDAERRDLRILCGFGKPVILVLNIGGVMDLSPLDGLDGVRAVVLLSQPGMEGGSALADVLCGRVNPCGKLTDSWAYRYADYPCAQTGGDEPLTLTYREGIYVGYRYFDTFSVPVRYGFGAGLSYTEFFIRPLPLVQDGDALRLPVQVTNTGLRHAGRETVQVYATCPRGGQDREYRRLVAFAKTDHLQPGAAQRLELRIPLESLCAYDPDTGCWQWNAGDYYLWVGASLAQSKPTAVLHVAHTAVQKTTVRLWPDIHPETLHPDTKADLDRRAALANYARRSNLPWLEPALPAPQADPAPRPDEAYRQAQKLADTLPDETLVQLCVGQWQPQQQDGPLTGVADTYLPGAAGVTSAVLQKDGVPPLILADGPAGLRVSREYFMRDGRLIPLPLERCFESGYLAQDCPEPDGEKFYQFCTAFPIGTMLAQSWDTALLQAVGHAVGREMKVYRVALWLAPGMNLHRDPLCGRNFEYFSEDPLLSGRMAAAMTAIIKAMGEGKTGGTAFMEDYTYNLVPGAMYSLGAHMLEVCPSVAAARPRIEVHPLGIGDREPPARLVFEGHEGSAIVVSLVDMGGRLRLICQDIHCVKPILPMPNLPVARVMWQAMPDLTTGLECWISAGGAHHTTLTYDVSAEQMQDWARMMDVEFVHITADTTVEGLEQQLFLNDLAWKWKA